MDGGSRWLLWWCFQERDKEGDEGLREVREMGGRKLVFDVEFVV